LKIVYSGGLEQLPVPPCGYRTTFCSSHADLEKAMKHKGTARGCKEKPVKNSEPIFEK
jgi:hypothetical protein